MSQLEHCSICGAPATRRIKGDWYCSKHTPYQGIFEEWKKKEREEPISKKVWQMRNERLRELPMDCRIAIIEEIVKADVRQCIENSGISDPICQLLAEESGDMEEYLLSESNPGHQLPIYKIKGKFYFRDERLGEYRNIKDPHDRRTIDSVDNRDLEKPTAEDTKKVFGKCDKNPCDLKIKGKRDELDKATEERVKRIRWEQKEFGKLGLFEGIDTECGYCGSHDTTFYTDEKGWTFRRCNSCHKQDNITTLVGRHKRS